MTRSHVASVTTRTEDAAMADDRALMAATGDLSVSLVSAKSNLAVRRLSI
jgi:hypothetical protein